MKIMDKVEIMETSETIEHNGNSVTENSKREVIVDIIDEGVNNEAKRE
jgi:hypothetical protein